MKVKKNKTWRMSVCAFVLMGVWGALQAASWVEIERFEDGMLVFASRSGMEEVEANVVRLKHLVRWAEPQIEVEHPPYRSTVVSYVYDCAEKKEKYQGSVSYSGEMGDGSVIISDTDEAPGWESISEDSMEEKIWKLACEK